ncbi:VCBS repeat-containing protein [Thalassoglobus sp. JC818]|uniref:FG-GAP repeat domain-containing protein n=1 Tax=Thalassoglobus sp. JC818 TaxID=3232136 RepID=UPI00345745C2
MRFLTLLVSFVFGLTLLSPVLAGDPTAWIKHTIYEGGNCQTAIAGDFTGDGLVDVISHSSGQVHLHIAPDWTHVVLYENRMQQCIHSEAMDVDQDGDLDYICARYNPGLIAWLENPGYNSSSENKAEARSEWKWHLVDDQVHGIHGLLVGDVNLDGHADLIANSAQPVGEFPESVVWYDRIGVETGQPWKRYIPANQDAPGLSHYLGLGDVNHDGRPDILTGAKGGPMAEPGSGDWFAWWEAPDDPTTKGWSKHLISDDEPGATNLFVVDVNGDGKNDVLASRGHGSGLCWFAGPDMKRTNFGDEQIAPHCLAIADFDGDGDIDAATCAKDSMTTAWFENDGSGSFRTHQLDDAQAAYDIRSIDMDGDGDVDLVVAGQASKNVVWYENRMSE